MTDEKSNVTLGEAVSRGGGMHGWFSFTMCKDHNSNRLRTNARLKNLWIQTILWRLNHLCSFPPAWWIITKGDNFWKVFMDKLWEIFQILATVSELACVTGLGAQHNLLVLKEAFRRNGEAAIAVVLHYNGLSKLLLLGRGENMTHCRCNK